MCLAITLNLTSTAFHTSSECPESDDGLGQPLPKRIPAVSGNDPEHATPFCSSEIRQTSQRRLVCD